MKTIQIILVSISMMIAGRVDAQFLLKRSIVALNGENLHNGNMHLSQTLGEPVIGTISGNGIILTQGFQQPEQYYKAGKSPNQESTVTIQYYPNPTNGILHIQMGGAEVNDLSIEVYDMLGKAVFVSGQQLQGGQNSVIRINLEQMAAGIYLVKIKSASQQLNHIYKINKTN